jgi:hypothetical protein
MEKRSSPARLKRERSSAVIQTNAQPDEIWEKKIGLVTSRFQSN